MNSYDRSAERCGPLANLTRGLGRRRYSKDVAADVDNIELPRTVFPEPDDLKWRRRGAKLCGSVDDLTALPIKAPDLPCAKVSKEVKTADLRNKTPINVKRR